MQYIAIFNGNPTAGGTDGAKVSQNNVYSNPVHANVDVSDVTGVVVPCAVRCETGMEVDGDVTLQAVTWDGSAYVSGSSVLSLSNTENGTYSQSITISNVSDTNVLFYAKLLPGTGLGNKTAGIGLSATVVSQ